MGNVSKYLELRIMDLIYWITKLVVQSTIYLLEIKNQINFDSLH